MSNLSQLSQLEQLGYNEYIKLVETLSLGVILPYNILRNAVMFKKSQISNNSIKEFFINKLK